MLNNTSMTTETTLNNTSMRKTETMLNNDLNNKLKQCLTIPQ